MAVVTVDTNLCNFNNACLRVCPTYAFNINVSKEYVQVNHKRCISCGHCVVTCPSDAIKYYDSISKVKKLLSTQNKNIAILDPSIAAEFPDITDYRKFAGMVRQLGFNYVIEANFAIDLLAEKYNKLISNFQGKYYIFTNCPAIINLISKFFPTLIENLTPFVTPPIASTIVAKKIYGDDVKVTWIGPCIAAKEDIKQKADIPQPDVVLTFKELRKLFIENNIKESYLEFDDFDEPYGYLGALLPLPEGFIDTLNLNNIPYYQNKIFTVSGRENVLEALKTFEKSPENIHHHLNIFYCDGCIMGPGMSVSNNKYLKQTYIKDYVNKRIQNKDYASHKKNIEEYNSLNLSTYYIADNQRLPDPPEEKIQEILKIIGKKNIQSIESCRACGYNSCRELAVAIAQGLAKPELCLNYSIKTKQEYIKNLKQTNEQLQKNNDNLIKTEKEIKKQLSEISENAEMVAVILQKLNVAVVIADENFRIIKSNKYFIKMLGEEAAAIAEVIPDLKGADLKTLLPPQFHNLLEYVLSGENEIINRDIQTPEKIFNASIFPIKQNKIIGVIIRDMGNLEIIDEEVIRRINEVIENNFDMVQKIAFLLGETASNTEKILNSIIEAYKPLKSQ